jgi:hypothetical protein
MGPLLNRRLFLRTVLGGSFVLGLGASTKASRPNVTIGAIRWDPWYMPTDTGPRASMEDTLGPSKWQWRAPRCAKIVTKDRIDLGNCAAQQQIDAEIAMAVIASLDYWAYVWYGPEHDLQNAWRLYHSSSLVKKPNWCMIFSGCALFVGESENSSHRYIEYFREGGYQKVLKGRPLVYLLRDETPPLRLYEAISNIRALCAKGGVGDPYFVLLAGAVPGAVKQVGADAIGIYSKANVAPIAGKYSDLIQTDKMYWRRLALTGQSMIPTVLTGADRRPRIERPVPWEASTQKPFVGVDHYYQPGTPSQIATHVLDMITWLEANSDVCPAQTGLIYSWDEHDEGGSTLNPTLGQGDAILGAVGEVLRR